MMVLDLLFYNYLYHYRTQALVEWKNKAVNPTYHCLLCICIAAEWTDSANIIIELLENE